MHFLLLLGGLVAAWTFRCTRIDSTGTWAERWQRTLVLFLLPPLLVVTSVIAVVWMGPFGQMVWPGEGWLSYGLALCFLGFAAVQGIHLTVKGIRTLQKVRTYPTKKCRGIPIRVLDLSMFYSAQVGFWQPELVMSRGLLEALSAEHLEAVLAHEQAHLRYRDTFCFFCMGWIRRITAGLPQTESLWQELLVLRELRADRWAAARTDSLHLAEALLLVVDNVSLFPGNFCVPFSSMASPHRLAQRIDSLLSDQDLTGQANPMSWLWLLLATLPLLLIPFHH